MSTQPTKNKKIEADTSLLNTDPFEIRPRLFRDCPIRGLDLYYDLNVDDERGFVSWIEEKFEELNIEWLDYRILRYDQGDEWNDEVEYYLSPAAALKIAATFDNDLGEIARRYLEEPTSKNARKEPSTLPKCNKLHHELLDTLEEASKWHRIANSHRSHCTDQNKRGSDKQIDAAYSAAAVHVAEENAIQACRESFEKIQHLVRKIEAELALGNITPPEQTSTP